MNKIILWVYARDVVTDFSGIVTSITKYLSGCDRVVLTPKAENGEIKDGGSFDITTVEFINEGVSEKFKEEIERPVKKGWPEVYGSKNVY